MRAVLVALLMWLGSVAAVAAAEASDWATDEPGRVRLVSAVRASGEAGSLRLGLEFRMQPGWKIYWRNPGDAGYPPRIDWAGSDNLADPQIRWPAPHRFILAGLQNHGYVGEVILPLDVAVPRPGRPVSARAAVEYLACAQICLPQRAELALDIPAGPAEPSARAHDIGRFAAQVPGDGRRHGLTLERAEAVGEGEAQSLRVTLAALDPLDQPDLFVEAEDGTGFGQPRVSLSADRLGAVIEAPVTPGTRQKQTLAGEALRLTVVDGMRSLEAAVAPASGLGPAAPGQGGDGDGLAAMLLVALLGGLVLNLMPCVLPVLSIKLLGILGHGGAERGHARASFLASAAGIVASFLALAGIAVAVKQAGMAVGWGIQFQQPGFLAAMVALLGLFAVNLWGAFEIPMPSWLMSGGKGVPHHTLLGHFLSGAFATLLATPCSAPFLGTAVGFALARGSVEIVAIFAALGIGMAAPFLGVAAWPDAALKMPRPGRWMLTARRLMGLALAGTGLWLLTVLAVQSGEAVAAISGGAVAGAMALLVFRARLPAPARSAVGVSAAALVALALAAPFQGGPGDAGGRSGGGAVPWVAFERAALDRFVAEGKVVFVDVTADWCITCKVNKAAVVERGEVARRLGSAQFVAMKADWTRPDEAISRYLASFGRYGIPFNAVYGPAASDGIALSELLGEVEILAAMDKAAGVAR